MDIKELEDTQLVREYVLHGSRARRFQRRRRTVQRPTEKPSVNPQTTLLDFVVD